MENADFRMRAKDKTIVLTGASSGIGEAAAKKLAERGARMCLIARREDELQRVQRDITDAGGEAWIYPADLADEQALTTCAEAILTDHGEVDVLINNAGRSIRRPITEAFDRLHDYRRTMQINYFAAVQLTLAFLPGMVERRRGHIVNVSSYSTLAPVPRFTAYVGSKGALEGFSQSLRAELTNKRVTVTVINYPLVRTPMVAPTKMYEKMPMMRIDTAADWMVEAVEKRPARVAKLTGQALAVAKTMAPGTTNAVMSRFFNEMTRRLQRRAED